MDNTKFQINILPVGVGDCIHLRFFSQNKWYNIVIDSGPQAYAEQFLNLLRNLGKEEQIDLLCFTHIDDDHIKAAEHVFGSNKKIGKKIQNIWINIPEYEKKQAIALEPESSEEVSIKNALKLYRHILWFEEQNMLECKTCVLAGESLTFGDVTVTAVLPYDNRIKELEDWWVKKRPYQTNDEDVAADPLDHSATNGSSIVLLVDAFGKKLLFTGDAFAKDLYEMATKKGIAYDLVKLPHHGSSANITTQMLEAMSCSRFIISADGSRKRPAQGTVNLLAQYAADKEDIKAVILYGNYKWSDIKAVDGVNILQLKTKADRSLEGVAIRTEAIRQ